MRTFNIAKTATIVAVCLISSLYSCKGNADEIVQPTSVTDDEEITVLKATTAPVIRVIAGGNGYGYQDGKAKDSKLGGIEGLWVNKDGSLYLCDFSNDAIRKVTGDSIVSTVELPPAAPNSDYSFSTPRRIAVLNDGTFVVIGYDAMFYFKLGGTISSNGIATLHESIDGLDADPDGKKVWLSINSSLYYQNAGQQVATFAYNYADLGSGFITALATCPNGVKYVASNQGLYKYTSKGVAARILSNLQAGGVRSMAVSRDGYKIYLNDSGTLKVITNDTRKPKTITSLAQIGNAQIALSNNEKYIYFTSFINYSVSKLTL
ncbi:hypothetical protein IM792_15430 [Mucilaginibacter sp. JRF]|uniref:hypothetical protein n=1 Tax=Mucilaginibacter sp. JRF TaxID=2780088 RepID=UPI00187F595F|nr:hypothetical protein [Mucilaginibacter sp. JRF]MBE9585847.1 hypothetical protein [Mucilaginibacter sp. JRF]